MNKRSKEKGGRKAARSKRVAQSKFSSNCESSVLSSVAIIQALTLDRMKIRLALQDALHFYDRATGAARGNSWSTADVLRLEEIRKLVNP